MEESFRCQPSRWLPKVTRIGREASLIAVLRFAFNLEPVTLNPEPLQKRGPI
jgi:hypothetical protein